MSEIQPLPGTSKMAFRAVNFLHRALRPIGLGNYKLFRRMRNVIYRLAGPEEMTVEVQGIKMRISPSYSSVVPLLLRDGVYEPSTTKLFRRLLHEGSVFVDIGAHVGYYSLIEASIVKERGKVISFEPEPTNYSYLERNLSINGFQNITLVSKALSDRPGRQKFSIDPSNTGGHHLANVGESPNSITVDTITLDDYLLSNPTTVDLIKMDVEEFEPAVLKGMKNLIERSPTAKLLTEFYPSLILRAGYSPEEFLVSLASMGCGIHLIDEQTGNISKEPIERIISYCHKYDVANLYCEKSGDESIQA